MHLFSVPSHKDEFVFHFILFPFYITYFAKFILRKLNLVVLRKVQNVEFSNRNLTGKN